MPRYPAKLLVLGEHTVVHGGQAYAVPLERFGAEIRLLDAAPGTAPTAGPQLDFVAWAAFAKTHRDARRRLDVPRWQREAPRLQVRSDIPAGYGLGSSGALTAAIAQRYSREALQHGDVQQFKPLAQALEDYFHGSSSGLDPLVSLTGRGIVVDGHGTFKVSTSVTALPNFGNPAGAWFLLDSGQPRTGKAAIARFGESLRDAQWTRRAFLPMTKLVGTLIAHHERGLACSLEAFRELSRLQQVELAFLIPDHVALAWEVLAKADLGYLKLCGAGGGGYFLGYAPSRPALELGQPAIAEGLVWL